MYFYPDSNDKITAKMIEEIELFLGYWNLSEARLLDLVEKKHLPKKCNSMLDYGCGEGRLILRYKKYFKNITAIEPDKHRFEIAKENIEKTDNSVRMLNGYYNDFNLNDQFDLILCSHIIQHISNIDVEKVFNDIYNGLKIGGKCFLMTTHSKVGSTYYVNASIKNGYYNENIISEELFHRSLEEKDILPTAIFDIQKLKLSLQKAGLKLIKYYVFHLDNKNKSYKIINDKTVNTFSCLKKKHGRDMLLVIEKSRRV